MMASEALVVQDVVIPPSTESSVEQQLVDRAVRGERGAFAQLYQRHVEDVFNYVHFRVRDEALAEDLTQDVFINALRGVARLREPWRFRHWLLRIAHNRVVNHWRDAGRDISSVSLDTASVELPADDTTGESDARLSAGYVMDATARLTELQQQVIALRFVAGLSIAETAAAMDRSVNAVKNLQHNALAALRKHVAAEDPRP